MPLLHAPRRGGTGHAANPPSPRPGRLAPSVNAAGISIDNNRFCGEQRYYAISVGYNAGIDPTEFTASDNNSFNAPWFYWDRHSANSINFATWQSATGYDLNSAYDCAQLGL